MNLNFFVAVMSPGASEIIGLQFQPHGPRVEFFFRQFPAFFIDYITVAQQRLNMVPDFVRDHVGLREIRFRPAETFFEFFVKCGIDVDFLIGGTIEGTDGGVGRAARGIDFAREHMDFRMDVGLAHFLKLFVPDFFRVAQNGRDEFMRAVVDRNGRPLLDRRGTSAAAATTSLEHIENLRRINTRK